MKKIICFTIIMCVFVSCKTSKICKNTHYSLCDIELTKDMERNILRQIDSAAVAYANTTEVSLFNVKDLKKVKYCQCLRFDNKTILNITMSTKWSGVYVSATFNESLELIRIGASLEIE